MNKHFFNGVRLVISLRLTGTLCFLFFDQTNKPKNLEFYLVKSGIFGPHTAFKWIPQSSPIQGRNVLPPKICPFKRSAQLSGFYEWSQPHCIGAVGYDLTLPMITSILMTLDTSPSAFFISLIPFPPKTEKRKRRRPNELCLTAEWRLTHFLHCSKNPFPTSPWKCHPGEKILILRHFLLISSPSFILISCRRKKERNSHQHHLGSFLVLSFF